MYRVGATVSMMGMISVATTKQRRIRRQTSKTGAVSEGAMEGVTDESIVEDVTAPAPGAWGMRWSSLESAEGQAGCSPLAMR